MTFKLTQSHLSSSQRFLPFQGVNYFLNRIASVNDYFNYNVASILLTIVRTKSSPHLVSYNLCGQQAFFQSANDDEVHRRRKQCVGFTLFVFKAR